MKDDLETVIGVVAALVWLVFAFGVLRFQFGEMDAKYRRRTGRTE